MTKVWRTGLVVAELVCVVDVVDTVLLGLLEIEDEIEVDDEVDVAVEDVVVDVVVNLLDGETAR